MQNNRRHTQITVHGNLAADNVAGNSEHQVYHYHVNILQPGQASAQDYDREIHIYYSSQHETQQDTGIKPSPAGQHNPPMQAPLTAAIPPLRG